MTTHKIKPLPVSIGRAVAMQTERPGSVGAVSLALASVFTFGGPVQTEIFDGWRTERRGRTEPGRKPDNSRWQLSGLPAKP